MLRNIFLIVVLSIYTYAIPTLKPTKIFKSSGTVQSIVYKDNKLYAGTSNGTVEIFDTKTTKKINEIKLPNIKDFMGDIIPAKIYSIDLYKGNLLIVSQGMKGYRNIFLYDGKELKKIIGIDKKYFFQKASFTTEDTIVFGLLSNQIGVYNFKEDTLKYLIQISPSSFSHFMVDENKKTLATTDESGIVRILNIDSGQIVKVPEAKNLDRVYQLDYKKGVLLTAGQDRQAVIYKDNKAYSLHYNFLLYSCGLSPKAKKGAIAYNEQNEVLVIDINTQQELFNLTGQRATLTQILFINENEVYVSSDDSNINYFKLNNK